MEIITGRKNKAERIVVYGPEGIGKSTFAAQFPDTIFSDTEGSTDNMDLKRFQDPSSWELLIEQALYIKSHPNICKTYAIDTADWSEKLCIQKICADKDLTGIEDMGYGKGYTYLEEQFGKYLNLLRDITDQGITIVVTAHASMRKFEQPDELGAYDRWELKLQKKTAALLKEWATVLLFANYETFVINVDNQGAQKGKNKARGGKRILYTTHHPCWDAKNRHGMPEKMDFSFDTVAPYLNLNLSKATTPKEQEISQPIDNSVPNLQTVPSEAIPKEEPVNTAPVKEELPSATMDKQDAMKQLFALMAKDDINRLQVQKAVAARGYYPEDTPIENYDVNFIRAVLISAWKQILMFILEQEVPF